MVVDCEVSDCRAFVGGGMYAFLGGTFTRCLVERNRATDTYGGGGIGLFETNGTPGAVLNQCTVRDNTADGYAGGVLFWHGGTANNCLIVDNTAYGDGGAVFYIDHGTVNTGVLNNCTVAGNYADVGTGGVRGARDFSVFRNCIIYGNETTTGPGNVQNGRFHNCCTVPMPKPVGYSGYAPEGYCHGGCISNNPGFLDPAGGNYRLRSASPCRDTGTNTFTVGDIDLSGDARIQNTTVDMGAYEHGLPLISIISPTNEGYTVYGEVSNHVVYGICSTTLVSQLSWTNRGSSAGGMQSVATNWTVSQIPLAFGANAIIVSGTNAAGTVLQDSTDIWRSLEHGAGSPDHYVATNSPTPAWPYTNWDTAAHVIQEAIDVAVDGDTVWATDGVYSNGARPSLNNPYYSNRVMITKAVALRSMNGPSKTVIEGHIGPQLSYDTTSLRCVWLQNGAELSGFTLTNGCGYFSSGGALIGEGSTVSNCLITHCRTDSWGGGATMAPDALIVDCVVVSNQCGDAGGGLGCSPSGTVRRCTIEGNRASYKGGGVHVWGGGVIDNCLIVSNESYEGGGVYISSSGNVENCTVLANTATNGGGVFFEDGGIVANSIVYHNEATGSTSNNWTTGGGWTSSCTTPDPGGTANITAVPFFVDEPAGDYHLYELSVCIDAGTNVFGSGHARDGLPRPLDGDANGSVIMDMGCYEHVNSFADSDGDGVKDGHEVNTYGTDPTSTNTDGDVHDDYQEVLTGTDGADASDYFLIKDFSNVPTPTVYFNAAGYRWYRLYGRASLTTGDWSLVTKERPTHWGPASLSDTNEPSHGPLYRLTVGYQ